MNKNDYSVFLTVGNQKQKNLCEKLLSITGIKNNCDITVVSDDDFGCRLGSGGAVLNILRRYYSGNEKMLIINSGGMSKRSVNFSLRGKAFANILRNGEAVTLLEQIINDARRIMDSVESGMLICCSDILVKADNIDCSESFGVCIKTDTLTGSRHGVMLCDETGKVIEYLHKRPAGELQKICGDSVLVDTGVSYFTGDLTAALHELAADDNFSKLLFSREFELNLYSDIINLLCERTDEEEYLKRETQNELHREAKKILFSRLSGFSMKAAEAKDQQFFHFGSTKESLENIFHLSDANVKSLKINSYTDSECETGVNVLFDNAHIISCKIGNKCIISDVSLENISVSDEKAVCGVKLSDGSFVTVICDIHENPKDEIGGVPLWKLPRFYKGKSFTDSLKKYYAQAEEEKFSLEYCFENADYDYHFIRYQYLNDMNGYTVNRDYLKKRREITEEFFSSRKSLDKAACLKDRVEISLPLRINLSGTWTDAMPYCVDNGGKVINAAVEIDGQKPVKVIAEKLDGKEIEFCSDGNKMIFCFDGNKDEEDLSDFNLHAAVLKTLGITKETVLETGFRLTACVDGIDKGSGLGTSSILLGGCITALGELLGFCYGRDEIIQMVFVAEQIMKTGGGWQDQIGGLIPGVKAGTSASGTQQHVSVEEIVLSDYFEKLFSERAVLIPTGQRHFGRFVVNDVVNRYLEGNEEAIAGYRKILALNDKLTESLENDDYNGFVRCINSHRETLKMISPKVTNPAIEAMVTRCFEIADAISYLGAGGGGYLLAILKENISLDETERFIKEKFPSINSDVKKINICREI